MAECELTCLERSDLDTLEATIDRGLATFVEVGRALLAIRGRRLYRATHSTFEAYILDRWGFTKTYANNLISAAEVVENLTTAGCQPPATERQARPLAQLPAPQQAGVWKAATAGGEQPSSEVLADLVARARARLPPSATEAEAEAEAVRQSERRILDQGERDRHRETVAAVLRAIRKARRLARQLDAGEQEALAGWLEGAEAYLETL